MIHHSHIEKKAMTKFPEKFPEICHVCRARSASFQYHGQPLCTIHFVEAMVGYSETSGLTPLESAIWYLECSEDHLRVLGLYEDLVAAEEAILD